MASGTPHMTQTKSLAHHLFVFSCLAWHLLWCNPWCWPIGCQSALWCTPTQKVKAVQWLSSSGTFSVSDIEDSSSSLSPHPPPQAKSSVTIFLTEIKKTVTEKWSPTVSLGLIALVVYMSAAAHVHILCPHHCVLIRGGYISAIRVSP